MSGDGKQNVKIPSIFLFGVEGNDLLRLMRIHESLIVFIGDNQIKENESNINALNGVEKALDHNTEQLRSLVISLTKKCSINSRSLSLLEFLNFESKVCNGDDLELLDFYYSIFNRPTKPVQLEQNKQIDEEDEEDHVYILDEAIELVYMGENNQELNINLNALTQNEVKQGFMNDEAFAQHIYRVLLNRFETKTNIMELANREAYSNSLFNFVKFKLNAADPPNFNLTDKDRIMLKQLANEIDIGSKHVESFEIITRKKFKSNNEN